MKPIRKHAAIVVLVLLAACGGGSPADQSHAEGNLSGAGVLLTTEKGSYQEGDAVELTIQNQESDRLAYNACTRQLEINQGGTWVPGLESLRLCAKNVSYAEAGSSRQDSTDLDLGLAPGDYRLVISFARDFAPDGDVIRAHSNAFTITP